MIAYPNLMSDRDRAEYTNKRQDLLSTSDTQTVMGEAGTGKTHNLKERWEEGQEGLIVTPTHRAANVLRQRIPEAEIGTYHSKLIHWLEIKPEDFDSNDVIGSIKRAVVGYRERGYPRGGRPETVPQRLFSRKPQLRYDTKGQLKSVVFGLWVDIGDLAFEVMVDEGSMVGDGQVRRMINLARPGQLSFYLDPFQLPPVKANPFWVDIEPTTLLTKNYRAGGDLLTCLQSIRRSETLLEAKRYLPTGEMPHDTCERVWAGSATVIAWRNRTVANFNRMARSRLGLPDHMPVPGEPLICTDNMPDIGLFNNQPLVIQQVLPDLSIMVEGCDKPLSWTMRHAKPDAPVMARPVYGRDEEDGMLVVPLCSAFCVTAHSAQGGEWDEVYVLDESDMLRGMNYDIARRQPDPQWGPDLIYTPERTTLSWLYTAATRARKRLVVEPINNWNLRSGLEYVTPPLHL